MKTSVGQRGAFILATVIFLMVVGSVMLYSMTNLSQVASSSSSLAHNGNVASSAAHSALKYCIFQLDTSACTATPDISGFSCTISVSDSGCFTAVAPATCTITATALCPPGALAPPDASLRGAKSFTIQVQKTPMVTGGDRYQMVPASLRAIPP